MCVLFCFFVGFTSTRGFPFCQAFWRGEFDVVRATRRLKIHHGGRKDTSRVDLVHPAAANTFSQHLWGLVFVMLGLWCVTSSSTASETTSDTRCFSSASILS